MHYEIDWASFESEYQWATIDQDGTVQVHADVPEMEMYDTGGVWASGQSILVVRGDLRVLFHDWQKSLQTRP